MGLDHRGLNCIGEWQQDQVGHWRCTECRVLYDRGSDVDELRRIAWDAGLSERFGEQEGSVLDVDALQDLAERIAALLPPDPSSA